MSEEYDKYNQTKANVEEELEYDGEIITQPFSPSDIIIKSPPMTMGDLIDMIREGWINFSTEFQTSENLWSLRQQSRLIESILLGLRLPAFYFEEVYNMQWKIIDGMQRCCAIRNFCVDKTLTLSDLELLGNAYNGKRYDDLDFATKRDIRMLPVTVNVLAQGVPGMVKYVLFKRLNTDRIDRTAILKDKNI